MRTTSVRLAACASILGVSLAGCTSGTDSPAGSASASAPTVTGSETSTANPQPSSTGGSGIPAGALLQPADVRDAEAQPLPEGEFSHLRPLRPCGDERYSSDGSREEAVAVRYFIEPPAGGDVPAVVTEFVGQHAPGGAAEQFKEIGDALKRCPGGLGEGQRRWTVLGTPSAGDQSVLVRIEQKESYADEKKETVSRYAAMARVGDVIVVVTDLGWENTGGSEKLVRDLIGKAAQRAATIS
ncbi:hypothetical protein [Actinoplanes auranticolor]|uniref:hypothetical protein n=1 Tax=Actinoplanes auranticolor TaxID=47988 RepID=UPI001BB3B12C|nr:hypothetical protein [Actinoplanes auranticolor]